MTKQAYQSRRGNIKSSCPLFKYIKTLSFMSSWEVNDKYLSKTIQTATAK